MKQLTTAVILAGPPGSGKDTLADIIVEKSRKVKKMEFKEGLREACIRDFDLLDERVLCMELFAHRELKEIPTRLFGGLSPRQALIDTDTRLKEQYGYSMVGKWAASNVQAEIQHGDFRNFIFSDGGFPEEVKMVSAKVDLLIVVQIHAEGLTFENDSRDYYELESNKIKTIKFLRREGRPEDDAELLSGHISDIIWEHTK